MGRSDRVIADAEALLHRVSPEGRKLAERARQRRFRQRMRTGRRMLIAAAVIILAAILGLSTVARNHALGPYHVLTGPLVALPSALGVRREADTRFIDVINAWIDYNRGIGQVRDWLLGGLALSGVTPDDVPPEVTF